MKSTQARSRVGCDIGPYRLKRMIGRGGMGEVYEAEDTVKDRIVALKLLPEAVSHDPVFRKRLQREAHSAGRLQEPHVVPIHDYGEIDGHLFLDMRLIDGADLRSMLKRSGPLTPTRAVAIVRQIASALDAAHESGVTHRDVKPENILITRDDFAYLVDFGIAKAAACERLTQLGAAVGTFAYMAPERFGGDDATYRADIYSLACVLYECLTGSRPYRGNTVSTVITAHLMEPVPRPSRQRPGIPAAFDQVIAQGMAKKPANRYASAGDLAKAAQDALTAPDQDTVDTMLERSQVAVPHEGPGPTVPIHVPYPTPPAGGTGRKPNSRILVGAIGAVVAVALAGIGIWWSVKPAASSAESGSTTTTSPTRPTPTESNPLKLYDEQLLSALPTGYKAGDCKPRHPAADGALATVDCGTSATAGGPTSARFSLFADIDALNAGFRQGTQTDYQLAQCPGTGIDSPTTWHYSDSTVTVEGQVACGALHSDPAIIWTRNSALLLGDIQGPELSDLHQWLLQNG